jgi:predicted metal-dependent peptidase
MKKTAIIALDVSGSMSLDTLEMFVKKAEKFAKGFKVQRLIFDAEATEVKSFKKLSVKAGGGTDFNCIERFIFNARKLNTKTFKYSYPDKVIVITDGYGTPPELQGTQDRWIWSIVR